MDAGQERVAGQRAESGACEGMHRAKWVPGRPGPGQGVAMGREVASGEGGADGVVNRDTRRPRRRSVSEAGTCVRVARSAPVLMAVESAATADRRL